MAKRQSDPDGGNTPFTSLDESSVSELAELAAALGHPARVRILRLLVGCDAYLCGEIVDRMPLAQSTVSQHLKVLRDAGLVAAQADGPRVYYSVNHMRLKELKSMVAAL